MSRLSRVLDKDSLVEGLVSGSIVVQRQDFQGRMFQTYSSLDSLHMFMTKEYLIPLSCGTLTLHEVIPGDSPQRLKLDIDIPLDEDRNPVKDILPWDLCWSPYRRYLRRYSECA